MGTNTDLAACLTPSPCDLFAASLLYVNVFNKLFVYVSTYDVFRASLASIGVAKQIILLLAILKSLTIAFFPSDPKSL